ncbi:hypothetical protein CRUP_019800, partial [Coryphaenoides rupestris]
MRADTHGRSGVIAVAALVVGFALVTLAFLVYKVTKRGTAGWLSIHKPVLLLCSSGQPAHVSAVCALASILQGELCAAVRMALWSQGSERKSGAGAGDEAGAGAGGTAPGNGVADLGPLPWLYREWDVVQRAQGKVLLVWSAEAKRVFERTRAQKAEVERRKEEGGTRRGAMHHDLEEEGDDWKLKERTLTCGAESAALLEDDESAAAAAASITGPVLRAALARLQGALQDPGRSHPVVLISLRGLSHNRDIPKELRGVPRYCLPGDFRGLMQELGGIAAGTNWEDLRL